MKIYTIDLFNVFINLVLSIFIVILMAKLFKLKYSAYKLSILIVFIFLILYNYILTDELMDNKLCITNLNDNYNDDNINNDYNKYKIPSINVKDGTFTTDKINYYGTEIPIMGSLDGLQWDEVIKRVNYLKVKTQYPYRNITYTDFKTSMDQRLGKDMSGLLNYKDTNNKANKKETARWYPNNTILQINARDCTNYEAGHPYSCIQIKPILESNELINKKDKIKEKFISNGINKTTYKLINDYTSPTLFKNAPNNNSNVNNLVKDISNNLCRGCVIGNCSKGICGSKTVEKGNNNILDVEGYIKSYTLDNIKL